MVAIAIRTATTIFVGASSLWLVSVIANAQMFVN